MAREDEEFRAAYMLRIQALVEEHGWAVQGVIGDEDNLPFSYTVGLVAWDLPELIIVGLPPDLAQTLLNDLASALVSGAITVGHGDTVHQLIAGYAARIVQVTPDESEARLAVARRFAGQDWPVDAVQVVIPDAQGRWPWDPGNQIANQPVLGPAPDDGVGQDVTIPMPSETLSQSPLGTAGQ